MQIQIHAMPQNRFWYKKVIIERAFTYQSVAGEEGRTDGEHVVRWVEDKTMETEKEKYLDKG